MTMQPLNRGFMDARREQMLPILQAAEIDRIRRFASFARIVPATRS